MDAYINCDSVPVDDLNILEDRTLHKEDREKIEELEAQVMHELHENNRFVSLKNYLFYHLHTVIY